LIALDRANFEGFVWIVLSLGLIAFLRRQWWLAATLLGLAAAMKYFPAVLFALLLSRRKWRQTAYGIGVAVMSTVASCWIMGTTLADAFHRQASQLESLRDWWVLVDFPNEIGFQHSLFSVIRQISVVFNWAPEQLRAAYSIYFAVTAAGGLILYFLVVRKLPILNQILALTVCCVLLPAWSADYTLLHLYVPWALIVLWAVDHGNEMGPKVLLLLLPFTLAFTPQPYLNVGVRGVSGQLKAVVLLILLVTSLYVPLRDASLDSDWPTDAEPQATSPVPPGGV
jgi:hypothetical protein